jgi:hypothetical protein
MHLTNDRQTNLPAVFVKTGPDCAPAPLRIVFLLAPTT